MPIILKTQHEHPKKKALSTHEQIPQNKEYFSKQNGAKQQTLNSSIPTGIVGKSAPNQGQQAGQSTKENIKENIKEARKQKQPPQKKTSFSKQQKQDTKKTQKTLNVQIIKKGPSNDLTIPVQNLSSESAIPDKKSKKKKNKKIVFEQELSTQQRLTNRTSQLYTQFLQKYKVPFHRDNPQFMHLLRDSFSPFASQQIDEQVKIFQMGQDQKEQFHKAQCYNIFLFEELQKRKKIHEDRIYFGVLQESQAFNDLIWRQEIQSQPKKEEVADMFNQIHLFVISDVWDGQYQIKPKQKASKDEILYGSYKANQIRLAQSIIKQKITNLNDQFSIDVEEPDQQNLKFNNHKKFDLNSEQTKKAEQFVKKLQQDDKLLKQRVNKLKELEQEELIAKLEEEKQRQKQIHEEKLKQRRAMLLRKAEQRERLKLNRQEENAKYSAFLSQHRAKTPLFKKKQEDFKAFLVKQHLKKLQAMKQVQKHRRVISKDQIQIHQIKYKELKQLLQEERQQMHRLQRQQNQEYQPKSFYRGKFFKSIMSQVDQQTVTQQKRSKAQQLYTKKIQYATIVKNNFAPKIDSKKKEQLQRIISDLAPKIKDDKYVAEKTKMEGQRNLQRLHLFIGQLRAKGKIRKHQTPSAAMFDSLNSNQSRYTNYLNELKTTRMGNSSSMRKSRFNSLDLENMNRQSVGLIEIQARKIEEDADRRSLFLKNTKHLDIQEYLTRKFQVQDDYVDSAKAKIKLINKYQIQD